MNIGKAVLVATAVAALTPTVVATAIAQVAQPYVITVDEQGHMIVNGNPSALGVLQEDPISRRLEGGGLLGLLGLYYRLPFAGTAGDIGLLDPEESGALRYSDVFRFDGNSGLFFFSDADGDPPELGDLADVPQMPLVFQANVLFLDEQGVEGSNGLFNYQPRLINQLGFPDPGYDPLIPTYNFISDTPEPATVLLLGTGLLGIGGVVRRRRRAA